MLPTDHSRVRRWDRRSRCRRHIARSSAHTFRWCTGIRSAHTTAAWLQHAPWHVIHWHREFYGDYTTSTKLKTVSYLRSQWNGFMRHFVMCVTVATSKTQWRPSVRINVNSAVAYYHARDNRPTTAIVRLVFGGKTAVVFCHS